jgi:hypothetical protein
MLQLELDEAVEADLTTKAGERGLSPEQLAAELVRAGLDDKAAKDSLRETRDRAIEAMQRDRAGRTIGLNGMSAREFAHLDHKY